VDSEDFVWYVLEHLPMTLPSHFFPQASVMPTHIHTAPAVLCREHEGVIPMREPDHVCVCECKRSEYMHKAHRGIGYWDAVRGTIIV